MSPVHCPLHMLYYGDKIKKDWPFFSRNIYDITTVIYAILRMHLHSFFPI